MALTLFDLTYRTARELGVVREGTATGGSTSTVIDTNARTEGEDYWVGGTVWILRDAGGAGAAPEGEHSPVSGFNSTTDTLTLRNALTAAAGAGDKYAVGKKRYPLDILTQNVNKALQDLKLIPITDTSLTTEDDKTEYTLPAVDFMDLRQVFIQTRNDDSNDNSWAELHNWTIEKAATGTADTLLLASQPETGNKLKLVYLGYHPELHLASDKLAESVPVDRVIYTAASNCLNWYRGKTRSNDTSLRDDITRLTDKAFTAAQSHPIIVPVRPARLMIVPSGRDYYPGDRTAK